VEALCRRLHRQCVQTLIELVRRATQAQARITTGRSVTAGPSQMRRNNELGLLRRVVSLIDSAGRYTNLLRGRLQVCRGLQEDERAEEDRVRSGHRSVGEHINHQEEDEAVAAQQQPQDPRVATLPITDLEGFRDFATDTVSTLQGTHDVCSGSVSTCSV
jgi:hypothetical protein